MNYVVGLPDLWKIKKERSGVPKGGSPWKQIGGSKFGLYFSLLSHILWVRSVNNKARRRRKNFFGSIGLHGKELEVDRNTSIQMPTIHKMHTIFKKEQILRSFKRTKSIKERLPLFFYGSKNTQNSGPKKRTIQRKKERLATLPLVRFPLPRRSYKRLLRFF